MSNGTKGKIWIAAVILLLLCTIVAAFYIYINIASKGTGIYQKAEIFYLKGGVSIKSRLEDVWHYASKDMDIKDGDVVATVKDANAEIRFGKKRKNYISIDSETTVELKKLVSEGDKELLLKDGKVAMLVNDLDPESSFEIRTPQAICGVVGTGFDTEVNSEFCIVKVYEGIVSIRGINRLGLPMYEKVPVPAGKKIKIRKYEGPKEFLDLTDEEKSAWGEWKDDLDQHLFSTFFVYTDKDDIRNHYTPSGWVGDYDAIRREESEKNPHSGGACLKFVYTAKTSQGAGWAGVYWQSPVNNWGEVKGGYDLRGAQKITFWAKGEEGGEIINRFGIGGIGGKYPDSATREIGPIYLKKEWKQYKIDLSGLNLSCMSGGFYWMTDKQSCPEGIVFYLDDIKYE